MSSAGWTTAANVIQGQKNIMARYDAEERQSAVKAKFIKMFADALTPFIIKFLLQLLKEDLDAPEQMRIFSGPNKNLAKATEEVIYIAQSVEFKNALIKKIRLSTFGLALAMDLDTPIEDAVHSPDFYSTVSDEVEQVMESSRLQRILESPTLDVQTKLKQAEPVLKNMIATFVTRLRNGCYAEVPPNPQVCMRTKNIIKEAQFAKQIHNKATQKLHTLGQKAGLNLSSFTAFNVAKQFFKGGKRTRKASRKQLRRKQTRRRT